MSKNVKKPGADVPSDPRNKSLNSQSSLGNKGKVRRMPPPATLSTVPKKESTSDSPQAPNKHWGSTATPNTPDKPDWSQVTTSLPYQTPRSRTAVSNAEFPSLSGERAAERNVPSQKDVIPSRSTERPPVRRLQEGGSGQHSFSPSFEGSKYQQQRSDGQSESRHQGGQRQSAYYNQRSNPPNSRNNPYSNRQGQPDRNRSGYKKQHPSYDRDKAVPEMFADSGASYAPYAHSLPIRHANFESDMDAKGWAGKQDTVDYSEKIKFDSSGDEADSERVKLRRIAPPPESTERVPNKSLADPPFHKERAGMQQFPEYRTGSPESQYPSGARMHSPVRPGKPTQIMKRPTSESTEQTPTEPSLPERAVEHKPHSPHEEPPLQPQKISMRQTVPTIPSQPAKVSEPKKQTENTSDSVPESSVREVAWRQDKPLSAPQAPSKLHTKGSETHPPKEPANVWEKRKQNEPSEQQRQGLQDFPKLGDNDPVKSCVIIPTKVAEKQGGPRTQDDDVFTQDKGNFSWDTRRDRERRRSDDKRSYGRGSRSGKFGNESDKSQNWRTEGGETEDRNRFGDRGERDDRNEEDRLRKSERSDTSDRGRREDRGSSSRGYPRREYQDRDWEDRGSGRGRFQGRQDERGGDYWREKGSFRDNDRGQYRDNDRRQFRDNDRGQFRDNDRGQFRDNDRGQFRDNDRGQFRGNDRGQFRNNERRQFRDDDGGQYRNNERRQFRDNERGRFRDDDRGDKYGRKSSGEGRTSAAWARSGASSNVSYANAVSNRGDTEDDEVTAGQEGERVDQPRTSDGNRRKSDSQDSWRQPRQGDGHTGHMTYTQQRKFESIRADASEPESRAAPTPHDSDIPACDTVTEWTDVTVDPRREEGETASSISPSEAGFIEIRKNRNKGRGMSSAETEGPRSLGRGRGRIQEDNSGIPGSRSMGPSGKTSSTTDPRFSRGGSPQKTQGLGRARIPERTNHVSPKRNTQRAADYDKKPAQHPRGDSPPPTQTAQKLSASASSSSSNYVQPGLSFSAIASKNIEKNPPPPPPQTPTKASTLPSEEKDSEKPTSSNDETAGKESEANRKKHTLSKETSADSLNPDLSIEPADEQSDKGEHLSDENDEVQEVVSTTIVNSNMKEEVDEIDKTPHAHLIAHSEHKEEPEPVLDGGDVDELDWAVPSQDRTPTPQKQIEKLTETAVTRQIPVPSKLEERPRSNTPIQASQPVPAPIPVPEHKKSDTKPAPLPTTSNVFPDASSQAMLQQPGFTSEWFNTTTMPSLGDIPSHIPFQYQIPQQSMTDDDKVVRSKQSDLADYVNAPEFLPSSSTTLSPYSENMYPPSLASANFVNPNYPPDFSQQTLMQSLQPSLEAATTAGGLLTAPRLNPASYPNSQFSLGSVYPPSQMMPGNIAASQLRPTPHQTMMRQFSPHPLHTSPNINPFSGYNMAQGNMRAAVMGADKNRRNDKMGGMGDKVPNPYPMYYSNYTRKWDNNTQYNNSALRKNTQAPFTPMVPPNIRSYNPSHRGGYRTPKKSNPTNTSGYVKSYAQPTMGITPSIHNPQYRANQSFISVVGPVRAQQQPQHVNQLRNPNNQFRGKNMQMNYYNPRQQMQYPGTNLYFLPQNNRGPQAGPHITSGISPSIESVIPPQALSYQMQTEGDMNKSTLVGPQFNIQIQEQTQKFRSFPSEHGEDSVASEYSKIGPVAVNGRTNNDLSDKLHSENTIFVPQVPNLLSSDPLQQGGSSDLIMKSHVDVSSASPPSVMAIYGPEPLVTSSTLASSSSETLAQVQSFQPEEKLSLPPTESPQDDQTQPQVNLES